MGYLKNVLLEEKFVQQLTQKTDQDDIIYETVCFECGKIVDARTLAGLKCAHCAYLYGE